MILFLLAQITPVQPIVKGTGLPPAIDAQADTQAVLATVQVVLDAIPTRDKDRIAAQLFPGGSATVAIERADGTRAIRRMTWDEWTAGMKPGPERFVERQTDPAVEIDGDMAMVWAPYTFTIDGRLSHCGLNHYSLVRDAGRWKIASLAWTQRKTGCAPQ